MEKWIIFSNNSSFFGKAFYLASAHLITSGLVPNPMKQRLNPERLISWFESRMPHHFQVLKSEKDHIIIPLITKGFVKCLVTPILIKTF